MKSYISKGARYVLVGDVDGCMTPLRNLLGKLSLREHDRLILLGNAIGPGPQSEAVIRYIMSRGDRATLIRGENEQAAINGSSECALSAEALEYVANTPLVYRFEAGEREWIAVHGGLPLGSDPDHPTPAFLYRRFERRGAHVHRGHERTFDVFWGNRYAGEHGHAFFGHQAWASGVPETFEHATGLHGGAAQSVALLAATVSEAGEVLYYREKAHGLYSDAPMLDSVSTWTLADRIIRALDEMPWASFADLRKRLDLDPEENDILVSELRKLIDSDAVIAERAEGHAKRYATSGTGIVEW